MIDGRASWGCLFLCVTSDRRVLEKLVYISLTHKLSVLQPRSVSMVQSIIPPAESLHFQQTQKHLL